MAADKLIVHPELCRDCQACMLACSLFHEGECNPGLSRVQIHKDMARYTFAISICQHCDPPECMLVCPVEAIRLIGHGVAAFFFDDCIQCGACLAACPHKSLFYHEPSGHYLKCDLCAGRVEGPACAQICPVGAIAFTPA